MRTSCRFDAAQRTGLHRAVLVDGMTAHHPSAVAGPKESAPSPVGGHVCGVGTDVGGAQRYEGFLGVINTKCGNAVG